MTAIEILAAARDNTATRYEAAIYAALLAADASPETIKTTIGAYTATGTEGTEAGHRTAAAFADLALRLTGRGRLRRLSLRPDPVSPGALFDAALADDRDL